MDEEKVPAALKLKLLEAEKQLNETLPRGPNWRNGILTAILTAIAFFAVGIVARAPIGSALGFAITGGITGLFVGAYRRQSTGNGKK